MTDLWMDKALMKEIHEQHPEWTIIECREELRNLSLEAIIKILEKEEK